MSDARNSNDYLAAEAARFGAMLAGKGLTPDQVATVMREQVQPVLADAVQRVESGEDVEFVLRPRGRS